MNKVWGIDFDSTINDMTKHICNTLNIFHDCNLDVPDVNHWSFWNDHYLGEVVWGERMYHDENWTLSIPPRKNSLNVIHNLIERGDKVVVISDRFDKEFPTVRKWLDRNTLSRVPLVLTNKTKSKTELAESAGCTSVIDDSPHWIDMYTRANTIRDIYVMHYEYNVDVSDDSRIKRIYDWKSLEREEFQVRHVHETNTA